MNNSEFIVKALEDKGVSISFSLVGGHALFLNKAFADSKKIKSIYVHNEQSTVMMAEGFFRVSKKMAVVNVTSAPAALNALNGVYGAYVDSIPVIIISGQPKQSQTVGSTSMPLRQLGDQEFDAITEVVKPICKYVLRVSDSTNISFEIEKCIKIATSGRPGPVWIDVPMDMQAKKFVPLQYDPAAFEIIQRNDINLRSNNVNETTLDLIVQKISNSSRPVLYLGAHLKSYEHASSLQHLIQFLKIPVVTEWNAHDLISTESPYFVGRPGLRGERSGNFNVYTSDLILFIGSTVANRQTGPNLDEFSPESFKIMVENDFNEFYKPNLSINLPVLANPVTFCNSMIEKLKNINYASSNVHTGWLSRTKDIWDRYRPKPSDYLSNEKLNPYHFLFDYFRMLPKHIHTVVGNGISVVGSFQVADIEFGQALFQNVGCASMGFDIPASIGASLANRDNKIVCLTGDGSFQLNIQELQTATGYDLDISFVVINNNGYDSIRQSQKNVFGEKVVLHGVSPDNGATFPNLNQIANAYGYSYFCIDLNNRSDNLISKIFEDGRKIVEVVVSDDQNFEPKVGITKKDDGTIAGGSLINMNPSLNEEEVDDVINYLKDI
jgi:acetolactate synthase I/II/III large subunit